MSLGLQEEAERGFAGLPGVGSIAYERGQHGVPVPPFPVGRTRTFFLLAANGKPQRESRIRPGAGRSWEALQTGSACPCSHEIPRPKASSPRVE